MPKDPFAIRQPHQQGRVLDLIHSKAKGLSSNPAQPVVAIGQTKTQQPSSPAPQSNVIRTSSKQIPSAAYSSLPTSRVVGGTVATPPPPPTIVGAGKPSNVVEQKRQQSGSHDFGFWKSIADLAHHVGSMFSLSGQHRSQTQTQPPPSPSVVRTASQSGIGTSSSGYRQSSLPSVIRINNPVTGAETVTTFDEIRRHLAGEPVFVPSAIPINK
ncbi:MAG: hypothetical protein QXU32_12465 [Nitrososphaerales archaeon]